MMRKTSVSTIVSVFFALLMCFSAAAQQNGEDGTEPISGFADIELGMTFDEVDDQLQDSSSFAYRGEDDVSFSPGRQRRVMEVDGQSYIKRGIFQFVDEQLFSITLIINQEQMDHYTLFTTFSQRYGEPKQFEPQRVRWEIDGNRLMLERPLTVQYLDMARFAELQDEAGTKDSMREVSRDLFLDQF